MGPYQSMRSRWIRLLGIVITRGRDASPGILACAFLLLSASGPAAASVDMGLVYVVKSDPRDPDIVFAGAQRGVFKSTDAGANWATTGLTQGTTGLAIAPVTPTTVYAGTNSGLFKSVDGGATWSSAGVSGLVCSVEIDPEIPTTLYASTCSQIIKSVNGGATWSSVGPPDGSISRVAIAVGPSTMLLYAASVTDGVRVYSSTDGGETWTNARVEQDVGSGWLSIGFDLSIDPTMPTTVYVNYWGWGDCDQDTCAVVTGTIKKSTDGGANWFPVDQVYYCCTPYFWFSYGIMREVMVSPVAIDPLSPRDPLLGSRTTLYAAWRVWWSCVPWDMSCVPGSAGWISKSTNGGETWSRISDLSAAALWFDALTQTVLYAATDSGVLRSTDGGFTWSAMGSPPPPPPPTDTAPPDTSITSAVEGSGTALASNAVTLSTSLTLSFTGTDNVGLSRFDCQLDGVGFSACTSPVVYNALILGAHSFEVRAVDTSGNVDATPARYSWTVDAPPNTAINAAIDGRGKSIANGGTTPSSTMTFRFTGTDNGTIARFECSVDSPNFTSCTSPATYSNVGRGTHTFKVRAIDNNGFQDLSPAVFNWKR